MPELTMDLTRTAILAMAYQNDIVAINAAVKERGVLEKASNVLEAARNAGVLVIHVILAFREGYPEVDPAGGMAGLKARQILKEGTPGAAICDEVAPKGSDIVVPRRRVSAFLDCELPIILKARSIETLVMMGVATSGVVLTTARDARDRDYQVIVIEDGCADGSPEVHQLIMERLLMGSQVTTSHEFISALNNLAAARAEA